MASYYLHVGAKYNDSMRTSIKTQLCTCVSQLICVQPRDQREKSMNVCYVWVFVCVFASFLTSLCTLAATPTTRHTIITASAMVKLMMYLNTLLCRRDLNSNFHMKINRKTCIFYRCHHVVYQFYKRGPTWNVFVSLSFDCNVCGGGIIVLIHFNSMVG